MELTGVFRAQNRSGIASIEVLIVVVSGGGGVGIKGWAVGVIGGFWGAISASGDARTQCGDVGVGAILRKYLLVDSMKLQ